MDSGITQLYIDRPSGASGRLKKNKVTILHSQLIESTTLSKSTVENFPCVTREINGANLDISFAPLS